MALARFLSIFFFELKDLGGLPDGELAQLHRVHPATRRLSTLILLILLQRCFTFLRSRESNVDRVSEGAHGILWLVLLALILYVLDPNQLVYFIQNGLI